MLVRGLLSIAPGLSLYTFPIAAVVISAWYGGRGPGFVALILCTAGTLYWFIPPSDSFTLPAEYAVGLFTFAALSLLLIEFGAGRRRVERELAESERRFRLMAETVPELLWIESIRPRAMLYASPRYEQIWERSLDELHRDPDAWRAAIHPEDKEQVRSAHARWLAGDHDRFDVTFRILRADGETRWIHSRGTLIRDAQGRPHRAAGVAEDVSEAMRAEEALVKAQADLAHVARVTTMGQLTATIAHEVNQPLAAIAIAGGACLRYLAKEPPEIDKIREATAQMVKDADRASEVIARVRALTRKTPGRREPLDVNEAIAEVVALIRSEAQKRRVALQTRLSPGLPRVVADRVQVQQVLLNLIINGIEAMSDPAEGPRDLIVGTAKELPNDVVVSVLDSGTGLGTAAVERVFEAFYTTKPGGMGMGLAICRSIIQSHGGRIWVSSNSPRGAAFHFTLPAAARS